VTATALPLSSYTWVIPTFRPRIESFAIVLPSASRVLRAPARGAPPGGRRSRLELDLDVDARGQIETHQRVHGLLGRALDVDEPLVHPDLELLARLLVDVRRAVHRVDGAARRQRHGPEGPRAGSLGRPHDLARAAVEH